MDAVQMVLATHDSLKAESLKMAPAVGTVVRTYIPGTGGARSL